MKIIEPNVQEVKDFEGVDNFYKAVARAARICYAKEILTEEQVHYLLQQGEMTLSESIKNTASIENDKALCERLIKSGHYSPFEHAIITVKDSYEEEETDFFADLSNNIYNNDYTIMPDRKDYIIINGRVLIESLIQAKDSNLITNSTIELIDLVLKHLKEREISVSIFKSFIVDTSIGCTREMNRHHDNFYICEQSTRYCNFSKDKFGNEITFNKPYWYDTNEVNPCYKCAWESAIADAEQHYFEMVRGNVSTDIIRGMLPLDTHTRAIYTATLEEWQHFIDLRLRGTTGTPHGDIKVIAEKINNLING